MKPVLEDFLAAKKIEGCSDKTICYYRYVIKDMLEHVQKEPMVIETADLRGYLAMLAEERNVSKVTVNNHRRNLSSFFKWLEDEDIIVKSPMRRIKNIKTERVIKNALSDDEIETVRDGCDGLRDSAIVELLLSTGMRVGELVGLDRDSVNFQEREIVVLGKGNKERVVYFDARAKKRLQDYLASRADDNPALFVSITAPHKRLKEGGIGMRVRKLGQKASTKLYPHKFRRTFATRAIDKGMPVEQVQMILGHALIDTTMRYAMVSSSNAKNSHRRIT